MLEQEGHKFGLRELTMPVFLMASPQQMHIIGFIIGGLPLQHNRGFASRQKTWYPHIRSWDGNPKQP